MLLRFTFKIIRRVVLCRIVCVVLAVGMASGLLAWGPAAVAQPETSVPIYDIQGRGAATAFHETRLDTFGVVTAVTETGFYLQDPGGDGDAETSDGIFVYTRTRPQVAPGACLQLDGAFVQEFYEKTELSRISTRAMQPSDRCGTAPVEPVTIPLARLRSDPVAAYERYEGMLVAVEPFHGVVMGPTKRFDSGEAEIALVDRALFPHLRSGRIFQWQSEYTAALMFVTSPQGATLPDVGWGDTITVGTVAPQSGDVATAETDSDPVLAILDYNFGKYQLILLPEQTVGLVDDHPFADEPGPSASASDFTVCTLNAKGLGRGSAQYDDAAAYAQQLQKRALAIAEQLQGCTIIGVQETGAPQDAQNLAEALRADFGLDYNAVAVAGPLSSDLEFPLTLSYLVRADRVEVLHVAQQQGCSARDYEVFDSPDICPPDQFPLFNRPPLVLHAAVRGDWGEPYTVTVVNNHWKSKGGDESVNVVRRTAQAQHVAQIVQQRVDTDPAARVIVLGDLNDFYNSEPVRLVRTDVTPSLVHVYEYLPVLDRYTYNFNGASQVLDHILVTPNMITDIAAIDPVHINADYPYPLTVDPSSVHHSSDHDPVVLRIRPGGTGWVAGEAAFAGIGVQLLDTDQNVMAETRTDGYGEFRFWDVPLGAYTVRYQPPAHIQMPDREMRLIATPGANWIDAPELTHQTVVIGATAAQLTPALGQHVVTARDATE